MDESADDTPSQPSDTERIGETDIPFEEIEDGVPVNFVDGEGVPEDTQPQPEPVDEDIVVVEGIRESDVVDNAQNLSNSIDAAIYTYNSDESKGMAYKSSDNENTYIYAITELPDLVDENDEAMYEGWLVNENTSDTITIGHLSRVEEGNYDLIFLSKNDLTDFKKLYITKESNYQDDVMEEKIQEADFIKL